MTNILTTKAMLNFALFLLPKESKKCIFHLSSFKGKLRSKKIKLKGKSVKSEKKEPSLTSMPQMVLKIFHSKVRNLNKMDIAILWIFCLVFT